MHITVDLITEAAITLIATMAAITAISTMAAITIIGATLITAIAIGSHQQTSYQRGARSAAHAAAFSPSAASSYASSPARKTRPPTASRDSQSASVIMPAASCRLVQQRPLRSVLARSLTFDSATNAALHLAAQKGSVAALLADRELGILAALLGDRFGPALGHLI